MMERAEDTRCGVLGSGRTMEDKMMRGLVLLAACAAIVGCGAADGGAPFVRGMAAMLLFLGGVQAVTAMEGEQCDD